MKNYGYIIINKYEYTDKHFIVIGYNPSEKCPQKWVCWYMDVNEENTYSFYWGYYSSEDYDIKRKFIERIIFEERLCYRIVHISDIKDEAKGEYRI